MSRARRLLVLAVLAIFFAAFLIGNCVIVKNEEVIKGYQKFI